MPQSEARTWVQLCHRTTAFILKVSELDEAKSSTVGGCVSGKMLDVCSRILHVLGTSESCRVSLLASAR